MNRVCAILAILFSVSAVYAKDGYNQALRTEFHISYNEQTYGVSEEIPLSDGLSEWKCHTTDLDTTDKDNPVLGVRCVSEDPMEPIQSSFVACNRRELGVQDGDVRLVGASGDKTEIHVSCETKYVYLPGVVVKPQ